MNKNNPDPIDAHKVDGMQIADEIKRTDTERLDWLERQSGCDLISAAGIWAVGWDYEPGGKLQWHNSVRKAIDAAIGE